MTIHAMEKRQHFKSFKTYAAHEIIASGTDMFSVCSKRVRFFETVTTSKLFCMRNSSPKI